ncbi:MAG: response regulator [Bacillota bacterium]
MRGDYLTSLPKILIVDDQYGVRTLLTLALDNYDVREAVNGKEALDIVKEWKPDLIIIDMKMPGLTGLETISTIKKMDVEVKILLMTAYDNDGLPNSDLGIAGFISKPFDLDKLISMVDEIINL